MQLIINVPDALGRQIQALTHYDEFMGCRSSTR